MSKRNETPDVWLGLRRCGCPVAVCVEHDDCRKDTEKTKREFLKEGLSVIRASWSDWQTIYMPKFQKDCEHEKAARRQG